MKLVTTIEQYCDKGAARPKCHQPDSSSDEVERVDGVDGAFVEALNRGWVRALIGFFLAAKNAAEVAALFSAGDLVHSLQRSLLQLLKKC
jgi:hypothetical protein